MPATVIDWAHSTTSSCRVHRLLLHGKREARRPPILSTYVISLVKKENLTPGKTEMIAVVITLHVTCHVLTRLQVHQARVVYQA